MALDPIGGRRKGQDWYALEQSPLVPLMQHGADALRSLIPFLEEHEEVAKQGNQALQMFGALADTEDWDNARLAEMLNLSGFKPDLDADNQILRGKNHEILGKWGDDASILPLTRWYPAT